MILKRIFGTLDGLEFDNLYLPIIASRTSKATSFFGGMKSSMVSFNLTMTGKKYASVCEVKT